MPDVQGGSAHARIAGTLQTVCACVCIAGAPGPDVSPAAAGAEAASEISDSVAAGSMQEAEAEPATLDDDPSSVYIEGEQAEDN